jgi:hypothetical protein
MISIVECYLFCLLFGIIGLLSGAIVQRSIDDARDKSKGKNDDRTN